MEAQVYDTRLYGGAKIDVRVLKHRELKLEGKCEKTPGQKIKQYIYHLAECIQLKPVQATKIHLVDSISYSPIKQNSV